MLPYKNNKTMTVINMLGGPGIGKSTISHGVTFRMGLEGMRPEYVGEVAKDYTWEGRQHMLTEQDYIFGKQNNRLRRLVGQVNYVVADTSLILGFMYMPDDFPVSFKDYVLETFYSYNNINILLQRDIPYDPVGRNQKHEEAIQIDNDLREFLDKNSIDYYEVKNTYMEAEDTVAKVLDIIKAHPWNAKC